MVVLGLAAALACFGAGIAVARFVGVAPPPVLPKGTSPALVPPLDRRVSPEDASIDIEHRAPKILFDPDSIQLLPDASLRLDPKPGFDAGAP
jgi:hypothetical protein